MGTSSAFWRIFGIVSLSTTVLFVVGFIYAVDSVVRPQLADEIKPGLDQREDIVEMGDIRMLALGDSLTKGVGDESGEGYVLKVKNKLSELTERPVAIANFAVNGYTTEQLLGDLYESSGMIESVQTYPIVLFTIGGNDMFTLGEEVILDRTVEQNIDAALERMAGIFKRLAELNPNSTIVYVGLYNPFSELALDEDVSLFVQQRWNFEVFKLASTYEQVIVVPTFDLFQQNPRAYLASDLFHPNEAGYNRIADRIVQALDID